MPVIYQGVCSACAYDSGRRSEGYFAVIVDKPCASMWTHSDDPHLVVLAHPAESFILDELGDTLTDVCLSGRMVQVRNVACKNCGTMGEVRRLHAGLSDIGCAGCLAMMCVAALAGVAVGCRSGFLAGWCTLLFLLVAADVAILRYIRWRYSSQAREFDFGPDCPKCHSKEYVRFPPRWGKLLCPICGNRTVKVRMVAKS